MLASIMSLLPLIDFSICKSICLIVFHAFVSASKLEISGMLIREATCRTYKPLFWFPEMLKPPRTLKAAISTIYLCPLCNVIQVAQNVRSQQIYSVQIRDVGRFLAKFNPWTNTFGNRLVRLHCSRIHPSVKLSTLKVYTCILMVAVSWKISVLNY